MTNLLLSPSSVFFLLNPFLFHYSICVCQSLGSNLLSILVSIKTCFIYMEISTIITPNHMEKSLVKMLQQFSILPSNR